MSPPTHRPISACVLALLALGPACGIFGGSSSSRARRINTTEAPGLRWRSLQARDGGALDPDAGVVAHCPAAAVHIPGGSFVMGSPEGEGAPDEHPSRQVTLRAYCIDRAEVLADAYTACVTTGACTRATANAALLVGDVPMAGIDWEQASSYCRFVGGRLPTEAEWEFAARGTDGRRFPWGNEPPTGCERADWTPEGTTQSCAGVGPSTSSTRTRGASPFGVLDMAGNVWEWTADWYAPSYPPGVTRDPIGPEEGSARVTRGGGWNNDQIDRMRATWREGQHPAFHDYDLGVRCAYDAI